METRSNHVWVGTVTLVLLALIAAFVIWVTQVGRRDQHDYDIFFKQSVDGLSKGVAVNYAGVPAGQVTEIELWPQDPSFVRVRIAINDKIPILLGTTATMQGSFTGGSTIQLNGGIRGAAPISEPGPGPNHVPVIPTKRGGLGEILSNAPVLLERLATLTDRMSSLLSDQNQAHVANILANTDKVTRELAVASPQMRLALTDLQGTLNQATTTLAAFEQVANSANTALGGDGKVLAKQLRDAIASAKNAADALQATMVEAKPAVRQFSTTTLPEAEAAIRDLRATTKALRVITEKIDEQGAGTVISGQKLPVYKP